jgi:hypothetical protein
MGLNGLLSIGGDGAAPRMTLFSRILPRAWVIAPVCACVWIAWSAHARIERIEYISGLQGRANVADVADARSATGYADGQRELIVPERNEGSFDWISQTQQMFAKGEARVRRVDTENVPFGREVTAASPYRWWLGFLAWVDHAVSGRPIGMSVEHAALYADPLLQVLLVAGAAIFAARKFGRGAGALLSVGLAGTFPFASAFVPGMPDQGGLALIFAFGSILVLLAGMNAAREARRMFAVAGIIGGVAMWLSVSTEVPIVLGVFAGALAAARLSGRGSEGEWRAWAVSGGTTVLLAYVAEYFPGHMASWSLESVHPLYGIAWIGGGELVAMGISWARGRRLAWRPREAAIVILSLLGVAAVPAVMVGTGSPAFLARGPAWARLTGLPDGPVAANSWSWLLRDGATPAAWATLLPLLLVIPAVAVVLRRGNDPRLRSSLAVALGPVAAALALSCRQLAWWSILDGALLATAALAAAGEWTLGRARGGWVLAAVTIAFTIPGIAHMAPLPFAGPATILNPRESEELVERHLAHWLARRTGEPGAVVFAPPNETTTLSYYGGLRGIGTFSPDNRAGFGNSLAIAGARTMEEAQGDLQARNVRYIVVPSWDPFFDDFARLYLDPSLANRPNFLVGQLREWNLPPWLRPIPYQMPVGGGYKGQGVLVFEVVDEQSPAAAAGRLAEYLVETGDLEHAAAAAEKLRRFPGDVGALAARAQVDAARGDTASFVRTLDLLVPRLSGGGDRYLPWDRRVSLAVVLARAERFDLAREQVRRCIADINEARLRSLSAGSLYGLLVLAHSFGIEIADPGLRDLALDLLPGDLRTRL